MWIVKVMLGFKSFYGLPFAHGAYINMTQIHIHKPKEKFARDYFSFEFKSYNMHMQLQLYLLIIERNS
jgi:hypothetical protein